jgi:hypothetical protein
LITIFFTLERDETRAKTRKPNDMTGQMCTFGMTSSLLVALSLKAVLSTNPLATKKKACEKNLQVFL